MNGLPQKDTLRTVKQLYFSEALDALKEGAKVAREGWNGKGMWIVLVPGDGWGLGSAVPYDFEQEGNELPAFIGMKTVDNKFIPWLASQTDLLAADWSVVT